MDMEKGDPREKRIRRAHEEVDCKFGLLMGQSELHLRRLNSALPTGVDLMVPSFSPHSPDSVSLMDEIKGLKSFVSGMHDARKNVFHGRMALVNTNRPYTEELLDRIKDPSALD